MRIYQYESYQNYLETQNATTKKKNSWVYAQKDTIQLIARYKGLGAQNILCHGTRAAGEQKYFLEHYPNAFIIGSEICDTAETFPMTLHWDFNKQNDDWIHKFDIVYTNSFDHSITPFETLGVWKKQLKYDGTLFLEYASKQSRCHEADPLDATDDEIREMITGNGMTINDELTENVKHSGRIFVCQIKRTI